MSLTIRRIKLNRDGYDSRGVYWGEGDARIESAYAEEEASDETP